MIPFMRPNMPEVNDVRRHIDSIFESGRVTTDEYTRLFEERIKEITKANYVVSYANSTSAFVIALTYLRSARKIRSVAMPAFEWGSVKRVCEWLGFKTQWLDIDSDTFNIENGGKAECVIANHSFGNRCVLPECDVPVIFDAAHGLGTAGIGHGGFCEIFSFTPHKIFCSFEGGALATDNRELYEYAYGMRRYFARMPEINAAVGWFNVTKKFTRLLERHRRIFEFYKASLPFKFQRITSSNFSNVACLVENRNSLFEVEGDRAVINDIECRLRYDPEEVRLHNTSHVWDRIVCLPTYEKVDERLVASKIREVLE